MDRWKGSGHFIDITKSLDLSPDGLSPYFGKRIKKALMVYSHESSTI